MTASTVSAECAASAESLSELAADPSLVSGVKQEGLLTTALDLYDGEHCPVCDKAFDEEGFVAHLRGKLSHLTDISARKRAIQDRMAPVLDLIREAGVAIAATITDSQGFTPALDVKALSDFKQVLLGRYKQLETFLPIEDTVAVLGVVSHSQKRCTIATRGTRTGLLTIIFLTLSSNSPLGFADVKRYFL